ncbi:unnamed protein product [Linum trigynum]|uniref:Salicylate carboxymethyltransferase n=1 Tax=Linum trigynum TaxID=586398 RepID=A0AAV2DQJ3_9ROSI
MTIEEVSEVLHMNGGMGETSYAMNSLVQKKVILMTKPITEEAIAKLYSTTLPIRSLAIADLGCSSGPNALLAVSELITAVTELSGELGRKAPEFQVFLNDLPGNDFNTIFRSVQRFQEKHLNNLKKNDQTLFVNGVPGSFYGRLFAADSLHFVHSSYSLQWLSQVPDGIVEENKGNIYMAGNSPPRVLEAYYAQFQRDFSLFLRCRAAEVVAGGRMVLTFLGRRSEEASSKECCYIWELMSMALNQMASEGLIDQKKLDGFNIPQYTPSPLEVEAEVLKEGSFAVDRLAVSKVSWDSYADGGGELINGRSREVRRDGGYNVANCMRAVAEPLLVSQFGPGEVIDEVFRRYRAIVTERMAEEKTEFVNVIVSLTKSRLC